jgi:DNA-binding MarR family transcriptional regulator
MTAKRKGLGPLEPGRFNYEGLDRVLHEKARLGILVSLSARPDGLLFGELKGLCSLTDGNLNRHLEVLSDAGLVEIHKGFEGKRPQTRIQLTTTGRRRFLDYLAELERVLHDALPAPELPRSARAQPGLEPA